jgi:alcohol dehydrogenase class IV
MTAFEFATAGRIVFGAGAARSIAIGPRALLVTHPSNSVRAHAVLTLRGEPTVMGVRAGLQYAREKGCDEVVAIGGGSAIDFGKAVAALLTNGGDPLDYLEVIGRGRKLALPSAQFTAVPTTAGTGSEVTRNAVIASPEHKLKASMRSPFMLPRLAIVDPELTLDLPPSITASTGLDALTQLIEPYTSVRANPMTGGFCLEGLRRAARALPRAFENGRDLEARTDMALASLFGGLALANAGLGVVHGFAAPIGGAFDAPHGAVCAALLAHGMEANIRALRTRAPESEALARYETIARILTGRADARPEDGVEWVRRIVARLGIPPLSAYGMRRENAAGLSAQASRASSMKGNPIALTAAELESMFLAAL